MQSAPLDFAALWKRWLSLVTIEKWRLAAVTSLLIVSGFAYEWAASTRDLFVPASLLNAILLTVCQYWTIRITLSAGDAEWQAPSQPRIVALIMLSIVISLGVLLGLVLLVLPGLYLAARWMLAACILVAEDRTIGESMKESWRRTQGFPKLFLMAVFISSVPLLLVFCGWIVIDLELVRNVNALAISVFEHIAISVWSMLLWSFSVVAYLLIRERDDPGPSSG